MTEPLPIRPYPDSRTGRTSGWSGSDTSRERAERADTDGTTSRRQRETLNVLAEARTYGRTWQELAVDLGLHHGQASGSLSNLHKAGRIARLSLRRSQCKVYVLPIYVIDRPTEPYGRRKASEES